MIAHVDQTAYAKRFAAIKKQNPSVANCDIKESLFHDTELEGVKMDVVSKVWKEFSSKLKKLDAPIKPTEPTEPPKPKFFDGWKKALKAKMG